LGKQQVGFVVENGRIFTPETDYLASIAIDNGKIVAIGQASNMPNADRRIDARGKIILPGAIDAHVHVGQPWKGTGRPAYYAEDVQSATMAAAMAGTTTICDMPDSMPLVTKAPVLKRKAEFWSRRAYVDFALHGGFVPNSDFEALIPELWRAGATALKTFMCFSEDIWPAMHDGELFDALRVIREVNGLAILHAENDHMLTQNKKRLDRESRKDFKSHLEWRPPIVEYEADRRAMFLLHEAGARGLIVHTSVPEGVQDIARSRATGQPVYVETCPHYLYLTDKDVERRGPWVKCSPPLRDKARVCVLRRQFAAGLIDTVGSDHSPFERDEVERSESNMWNAEAGMPELDTGTPLLLNGVNDGWLSLNTVVRCASQNPARIYGLYPRKGVIRVGSDADIIIVDMKRKWRVKAEDLKTKCGWSPYSGHVLKGVPIMTLVRGVPVMEDREIVGREGHGRFLARAPNSQSGFDAGYASRSAITR
jgi:allantoinase